MTETVGAERVCVALDRDTLEGNAALIDALSGRARWFKLGMGAYYAGGAHLADRVADAGAKLFLDLKLHDIPATVEHAARSLRPLQPALATVHASGGGAMIRAAVEGFGARTKVLAVTVLTSLDASDLTRWGTSDDPRSLAMRLGVAALDDGASGLVCSGAEVESLRAATRPAHPAALLVTPGIRPAGAAAGDQKRVMTPARAVAAGSSLLVVGRPIHGASDPVAALEAICAEPLA